MSAKRFSPAASALRSSRFFSLPQPLARAPEYIPSNTFISNPQSASATLPHPVQQALATPSSARSRGDWGLKRSLPRKSTQRTNDPPVFRINAVDTREHITDFDTASDLTATREKFLELGIPLSIDEHRVDRRKDVIASAFEPATDNTDPRTLARDPRTGKPITRWKHQGPWLAGLSEQEFLDYIEETLLGRKEEFLAFLREHESQRKSQSRAHADIAKFGRGARSPSDDLQSTTALASAEVTDASELSPPSKMSDEEFSTHLRNLRASFSVSSDLAELVSRFLDIPHLAIVGELDSVVPGRRSTTDMINANRAQERGSRTIATGPPRTHPSAGLSYLRTDAVLRNHQLLGPLARQPPTVARVLAKDDNPSKKEGFLGVAGFAVPESSLTRQKRQVIAAVRRQTMDADQKGDPMKSIEQYGRALGVSIEGGMRLWVEPVAATVDESGRVRMQLGIAEDSMIDGQTLDFGGAAMVSGSTPVSESQKEELARHAYAGGIQTMNSENLAKATGFPGARRSRSTYGIGGAAKSEGANDTEGDNKDAGARAGQSQDMNSLFDSLARFGKQGQKGGRGGQRR